LRPNRTGLIRPEARFRCRPAAAARSSFTTTSRKPVLQGEAVVGEAEAGEVILQALQQGRGVDHPVGLGVDEDHPAVLDGQQGRKAQAVGLQRPDLLGHGHGPQGALGVVRPGVEGAGEERPVPPPRGLHDRAPVAAGVDEGPHLGVGAAHHKDRKAQVFGRQEAAGSGQVAREADELRLGVEEFPQLQRQPLRAGPCGRRTGPRRSGVSIPPLADPSEQSLQDLDFDLMAQGAWPRFETSVSRDPPPGGRGGSMGITGREPVATDLCPLERSRSCLGLDLRANLISSLLAG
jgi:hypothetical protein